MLGRWRKSRNEEVLVCSIVKYCVQQSGEMAEDGDEHKGVLPNTLKNLIGKHEGRHNSRNLK